MPRYTVDPETLSAAAGVLSAQEARLRDAISAARSAASSLGSGTAGTASDAAAARLAGQIAQLEALLGRLTALRAWTSSSATTYESAQTTSAGAW